MMMTRCLRIETGLPKTLWEELVDYPTFVINRVHTLRSTEIHNTSKCYSNNPGP